MECLDQADIFSDTSRLRAATRGIWNSEAAARLAERIRRADPAASVVHCHGFAKLLSPAIGPVVTAPGVPHVYTMHEYFLACPNGAFFDFRRQEQCARTPLGLPCLTTNCDSRAAHHKVWRVARHAALALAGRMPRDLKDIVYISEAQLEVMRPYLPAEARLHPVANPIETVRREPVDVSRNGVFLFVGRLSREKGCVLLAKAAAVANVPVVFVGEGDARAEIEVANPAATITGWLDAAGVEAWFAKARCLAFPSLWREPFGLSILEAAARGVPTIAGGWGAPADLIASDATGLLVADASVGALSRALATATADKARVWGRNAYERYWANPHTDDRYLDSIVEVYERARRGQAA